ncbi:MerR family transcriptional regulator [Candidatus Leptofilum sp.]|uniref:MerR family transcriptional regulator n=1 Tax=Candidatus Leptofilum sp. TaxID=3241576 RepID=UPI003B5C89C8
MSSNNLLPTFNMKVVVHETGLKPDTLRAWERRYGVPNPQRTRGGHRLYSQHEIDMLKWLVARQGEGMSISHAVELWQQLESEGQNPLLTSDKQIAEPTFPHIDGERVDDLREAWIQACLAFDEYQAQHLLARAFALFPLETVCYKVLQQGLTEIGEGWYEGRVSVQQEHFASALALRQLEALLAALPAPTNNGRIIVACPPNELHTFSPLIISLMLRRQGWDVVYLGANVPVERMEASVTQIKPLLVIMPAQTLTTAANLLPMARKLQEMGVPLAFGGIVFNQIPQVVDAIPGHFLGKSLDQVPGVVEKILQSAPPTGKIKDASRAYTAAHQHFVEKRSSIEARLHQMPELAAMPTALLNNTNEEFGNNIEAALQLGDLAMISSNLRWVEGLLLNNHQRLSELSLQEYLRGYQKVLTEVMDDRAAPLLDWFAQLG